MVIGDPVNAESFERWKNQYLLQELAAAEKNNDRATEVKKPTGRQLFEQDSTLALSEFVIDDDVFDDAIDVDAFVGLDTLELSDDDMA